MIWYEVLALVVVALGFLGFVVKNARWKRLIENTKVVVEEARKALEDGKITKAEWLQIAATALGAFIPE